MGKNNTLFLSPEEKTGEGRPTISFAEENFILSESPPYFIQPQVLGALSDEKRESIVSYKVESGDNVHSVATKFGVSPNTIRWANNIKGNKLEEGEELLILPITGVMYYVEKGDTLGEIAKMHKAKAEDISSFNEIEERKIIAGDRLIIPGGTPHLPLPPAKIASSTRILQSLFINPVPGGIITQRIHSYNAVDIYNPCGSPIIAAASGRVTKVGRGSWPAGDFVKIDHGSVVILYAHMQNIYVNTGEYVSQGKQIGTIGNTGKTIGNTGCHLHFDVLSRRIKNPFAHLPMGARP